MGTDTRPDVHTCRRCGDPITGESGTPGGGITVPYLPFEQPNRPYKDVSARHVNADFDLTVLDTWEYPPEFGAVHLHRACFDSGSPAPRSVLR